MIINKPTIRTEGDEIIISSKIELENKISGIPEELWFRVPKSYEPYISKSSDAFLVSLIHLAMYQGEDINVKGFISPKLAYNIKKYQAIFHSWRPKEFKLIKITANELRYDKKTPEAICCTFSGGVDSFYTLLNHLPQNQPIKKYQLTHAMFIHGFDISLEEKEILNKLTRSFEKIMSKLKITLIVVKTNSCDFTKYITTKELAYGGNLIGPVLILDSLISQFYVASDDQYKTLINCGTHPLTDHLLSTENTEIHHDICEQRIKKILEVSKFPESYNNLRVCWRSKLGNCSECPKCIMTMATLKSIGALAKYNTFNQTLRRKAVRTHIVNYVPYVDEVIAYAKKTNQKYLVFDLKYALLRQKIINKFGNPFIPLWKLSARLKKKWKWYDNLVN